MEHDEASAQKECPIGRGWLNILDDYEVQFLVLDLESDSWLIELVQSQPEWVVDLQDGGSVLFARAHQSQEACAGVGGCP